MGKTLAIAAKIAISALLIAIVVKFLDVDQVFELLKGSDLRFVAMGYVVLAVVIALSAWRWHVLADGLIDWGQAVRYTLIGAFFGHVLPGGVSGDIAKGVAIALKHPETRELSLPASIVIDKLTGFVVLTVLFVGACGALFLTGATDDPVLHRGILALLVVAIGGLGGLAFALWLVASGRFAPRIGEALRVYARAPALLGIAAGISVVIHLCNMVLVYLTLRAIGVEPPLLLPAVAYPVVSVAVMLPIAISGIGVREIVLIGCFAIFGLGREAAVAQAWLAVLMAVPVLVLGALVQLFEVFGKRSRIAG